MPDKPYIKSISINGLEYSINAPDTAIKSTYTMYNPYEERIHELEKLVEHYASMVEHLRIQAKEAGLNTEPMSLSELFTNDGQETN